MNRPLDPFDAHAGKRHGVRFRAMTRRYDRPRGPQRGFSLIELIVVLVIAGLMLALIPPLVSSAIPGTELKNAARELMAGLRFARAYAISKQADAVLVVDVDSRQFTVTGRSRSYRLPEHLDLKVVSARSESEGEGVGAIRFFSDGTSTGGRITLSRGETQVYEIDINWLTGRAVILD